MGQIRHFKGHEQVMVSRIPLETDRFLEWRKREWWNLQETFAHHMLYEWDTVERLSDDVARHYGYEIENFPQSA